MDGMRYWILGPDHKPVEAPLLEWAKWFEDGGNRRVAETSVNAKLWVSTVFLGIDHNFGDGPPLVFETMVFWNGDGRECQRYATWDEAIAGHEAIVNFYRSAA